MLGKIEGKRCKGQQRMRWLDITTDSMAINLGIFEEIAEDRETWLAETHSLAELDST